MLERWKALAKIENRTARKNWGAPSGTFVKPATLVNPEEQVTREQRDARIEAWADAGMCTRDISTRTGLVDTTINCILHVRRDGSAYSVQSPGRSGEQHKSRFYQILKALPGENLCP